MTVISKPRPTDITLHQKSRVLELAFDDGARFELEGSQARHDRRVEELAFARVGGHCYIPLLGSGTVSMRRSMIASELMRSDSA